MREGCLVSIQSVKSCGLRVVDGMNLAQET
jgi:hypothetical protein